MLVAENVYFELDGGPHKIGGIEKLNSSAVASGTAIRGCYDYWKQGTGGTPARRKILHADTVILADNDDNIFANIFTGLENDDSTVLVADILARYIDLNSPVNPVVEGRIHIDGF